MNETYPVRKDDVTNDMNNDIPVKYEFDLFSFCTLK